MSFLEVVRSAARFALPPTLLLSLTLIVAGCTSTTPECPAYNVGAIEGRILGGGLPVSAWIRMRPFDLHSTSEMEVTSDSTGAFAIAVPSGAYYVIVSTGTTEFVYGPRGADWSMFSAEDTVHIGRDTVHLDINVGRLDVEIPTTPPFTDDVRCELCDARRAGYLAHDYASPDAEGTLRFSFAAVPPGTYALRLRSQGSVLWLPGSLDPGGAESVHITEGPPTEYAQRLDSWGRISGRDVGCWPDGSVPELMVVTADSLVAVDRIADGDGTFALNVLLAQPVRIFAEKGGVERWIGGPDFQHARVFDLHPGESLDDVVLVESGIECDFDTLVDWRTEFAVTLVGETGRLDVNGTGFRPPLRIPNLEPGTYRLRVLPERESGWLPEWYEGSDSMSTATPIVISQPGEIARVTMHLVEGGKIRGRILDANGDPVTGTDVRFARLQDGPFYYGQSGDTSDMQGGFEIVGLEDGDYIIGARTGYYSINWFPGVTDPNAAETIAIRAHAVVEGIEWRLP